MPLKTHGSTRSPVFAACVVFLGLLVLWMAQPFLPGWACVANVPGACPAQLLPVRASLISAGMLSVLLAALVVGLLLRPRADPWLGGLSRCTVIAVPVVLLLTVVAHFLIPQP
jgi:hypothetical protein